MGVHPIMAFAIIPLIPPQDEEASVSILADKIEQNMEWSREAKVYCGELLADETDPHGPAKARRHYEQFVLHYEAEVARLRSRHHGPAAMLIVRNRMKERAR